MCWNVVVILYKYVHTHIFMLLYIIILHGHLISWINHWHPLPIRWKPRTRGAFGCTTTLGLVGYGGSIGGELFLLGSWVEKYGVVMLKWDDLGCFFNPVGILSKMGDVSMLSNGRRSWFPALTSGIQMWQWKILYLEGFSPWQAHLVRGFSSQPHGVFGFDVPSGNDLTIAECPWGRGIERKEQVQADER